MEEAPAPSALWTEASQRADGAFGTVDSVPIAVAERLVAADRSASPQPPLVEPPSSDRGPSSADSASVVAALADESPGPVDAPPPPGASTSRPADAPPAPEAFTAAPADRVDESDSPVTGFTGEPAHRVDEPPFQAFTGEGKGDKSPSHGSPGYRPMLTQRTRIRVGGFLLAAVLIAAGFSIYWLTMRPTHRPAENTAPVESTVAPQAAPDASATSPQRANAPPQSTTGAQPLPNASAPQGSSDTLASPAKPDASAPSRVPSETVQAPESVAARAPSAAGPASVDRGTAKTGSVPTPGDGRRRAPAPQRSKEQADRDASATQRLIERELGNARRPDSDTKPPTQ